jgi:mycothiol synthase
VSAIEGAVGAMPPVVRTARAADLPGIERVMEASLRADAIPGFTRYDLRRAIARIPADFDGTIVAIDDAEVVAYVTPRHDDLTVDPAHRRRGHGRRLVAAAAQLVGDRGEDRLQLYVPGHLAASIAFATAMGFRYTSSLWMFRLEAGADVGPPVVPERLRMRSWGSDVDLERYVAFANASFESHPTPLGLTVELARHVSLLPEFDPEGILLVSSDDDPDVFVGYAKVELFPATDGAPAGYIAQIGVVPAWRGRGLGRALLRWGVAHLRSRGAAEIELSVEAENDTATRLYHSEGFEPAVEWPHWVLPVRSRGA